MLNSILYNMAKLTCAILSLSIVIEVAILFGVIYLLIKELKK